MDVEISARSFLFVFLCLYFITRQYLLCSTSPLIFTVTLTFYMRSQLWPVLISIQTYNPFLQLSVDFKFFTFLNKYNLFSCFIYMSNADHLYLSSVLCPWVDYLSSGTGPQRPQSQNSVTVFIIWC